MYFAHAYIPHFPAWAFLRHERLNAPLVVVAGGRVVAASAGLRRIGVATGVTAERVQALVPETIVRLRDVPFEKAAWDEALQTINRYTPFLERGAAGFAFFRPPDALSDTRALAEALGARIGMGPDRSIALLASLKPAEGTVLEVERRYVPSFLDQYPVERLLELDFDETFVEHLKLFGYKTLGKSKTLSLRHLKAQFGEEGERLHALLHPEEPGKPVLLYRPAPTITSVYEFEHAVSEPGDLLPALEYLIKRAAVRLEGHRCQRIRVCLQCRPAAENRFASRVTPEPVGTPPRIMHTARTLLMGMLKHTLQVETLTLELSALRRPDTEQTALFSQRPSLNRAVEKVHRRFPGAIQRAVLRPDAVFPEERTGLEGWRMGG